MKDPAKFESKDLNHREKLWPCQALLCVIIYNLYIITLYCVAFYYNTIYSAIKIRQNQYKQAKLANLGILHPLGPMF